MIAFECVRSDPSADLAQYELSQMDDVLIERPPKKMPTAPSFPRAPNVWGYTGSRFQGPKRALSIKDAANFLNHLAFTIGLPPPVARGFHILPNDEEADICFIAERGSPRFVEFRGAGSTSYAET